MFSTTQIWFSFYSGFSGTLVYDHFSGSLYNLFFTTLTVLLGAVFDRSYSKEIARLCPELYDYGPNDASFNLKRMLHSNSIFCCHKFMDLQQLGKNGQVVGCWVTNTTCF